MHEFPLLANFSVVSVGSSDEVTYTEGQFLARRRLSLVLRARSDTEITLSTGEHLSAVETHLTLISDTDPPNKLAAELTQDDLGFLIHTTSDTEPPFIHGAVAWPEKLLPYHLLTTGLRVNVLLTIASLPQRLDYEDPHIWQAGRKSLLRISGYSISCTNEAR